MLTLSKLVPDIAGAYLFLIQREFADRIRDLPVTVGCRLKDGVTVEIEDDERTGKVRVTVTDYRRD